MVNGREIMCVEYDVCASMRRAVDKYRETVKMITGLEPELPTVETPFLAEETRGSVLRKPMSSEDFIECPSCLHTIPKSEATVYPAGTDRKLKKVWADRMITPGRPDDEGDASDHESVGSTCTGDANSDAGTSGSEWKYSVGDRPHEPHRDTTDDHAYDDGWWSRMAVGKAEKPIKGQQG